MNKAVKIYIPVSIAALAVLAWLAFGRGDKEVECVTTCPHGQVSVPEEVEQLEQDEKSDPCDPKLLGTCIARLKQARLELQNKRAPEPGTPPETDHSPAEQENKPVPAKDDEPDLSKTVSAMFAQKLELDAQEAGRLAQIVCALKELRLSLIHDFAQEQTGLGPMWQELAALRKDLAADLEELLGAERYKQFREVGGIGAMGAAINCSAVGPSSGEGSV